MTKDEALKLALEAMEADELAMIQDKEGHMVYLKEHAITAIKAALEAKDDGITLTTIRHPRGKPALGDLNPESLEQVEIDLPEPIGYVSEGAAERLLTKKQAHEQIRSFRLFTHDVPVYALPQRTWVGLTDEEIEAFDTWHDNREEEVGWVNPSEIVAHIDAKLKEKNGG